MDRYDLLKASKRGMTGLKTVLDKSDHAWFVDLITNGIDSRVKSKKTKADKKLDADEIYELACYFTLVKELNKVATSTTPKTPAGKNPFRFAYAPGKKENFAFFRFETSIGVLDCCCGVEVPVPGKNGHPDEPPEAADIALQLVSSLTAKDDEHGELVAIWESKYHKKDNKLSRNEFNQMIGRLVVFGPRKPQAGDALEKLGLAEPFCCCAILTTSESLAFNASQRHFFGFSIAFEYDLATCSKYEPTRAEHLAYKP